jgi:hypothetical protein
VPSGTGLRGSLRHELARLTYAHCAKPSSQLDRVIRPYDAPARRITPSLGTKGNRRHGLPIADQGVCTAPSVSRNELVAVINDLGDMAQALDNAQPEDLAEHYAALHLSLTYDHAEQIVDGEDGPVGDRLDQLCVRGGTRTLSSTPGGRPADRSADVDSRKCVRCFLALAHWGGRQPAQHERSPAGGKPTPGNFVGEMLDPIASALRVLMLALAFAARWLSVSGRSSTVSG